MPHVEYDIEVTLKDDMIPKTRVHTKLFYMMSARMLSRFNTYIIYTCVCFCSFLYVGIGKL